MKKLFFILICSILFISCSDSQDIIIVDKKYTPSRIQVPSEDYEEKIPNRSPAEYEIAYIQRDSNRCGSYTSKTYIKVTEKQFKEINVGDTIKYYK
jgi:hypothetical protein